MADSRAGLKGSSPDYAPPTSPLSTVNDGSTSPLSPTNDDSGLFLPYEPDHSGLDAVIAPVTPPPLGFPPQCQAGSTRKRGRTPDLEILNAKDTRPSFKTKTGSGSLRETWLDPASAPRKTRRLDDGRKEKREVVKDDDPLKGMSVLEKLQYGLAKHRPTTVLGLQSSMNGAMGFEYYAGLPAQADEAHPMVMPRVAQGLRHEVTHLEFDQHYRRGTAFTQWMAARLAAVTGSRNPRVYRPYDEWKAYGVSGEIDIGTEPLEKCLQKACDENGYRTMQPDTAVFNNVERINIPAFDRAPAPVAQEAETIAAIETTKEGTISLTEVNVKGHDDVVHTWLWFRAIKSTVKVLGKRPSDLQDNPKSTLMFAVPTLKTALLEDT